MIIGFTTGCLYHTGVPFDDRVKLYRDCGANAIELAFPKVDDLLNYGLPMGTLDIINQFEFVSIHAPWLDLKYRSRDDENVDEVFDRLELFSHHINNVRGIVFHFDVVENWSLLNDFAGTSAVPILLENMDPTKKSGKRPEEFVILEQYDLNLVLDLFHAYENSGGDGLEMDSLACSFMANAIIGYIHASGMKGEERHMPLHISDDQTIMERLSFFKNWPIIMEGKIKDNLKDNLLKELDYVKTNCEEERWR